MKTLLWKDYRVNRVILIGGLVLLVTPCLLTAAVKLACPADAGGWDLWGRAALQGLIVSMLAVAFLGGNAFAGERMDRSAEFLAYLPPSRLAIMASKTLLALLFFGTIWGFALSVCWATGAPQRLVGERSEVTLVLLATMVLLYGASWLFSAIVASPAIATCLGIATVAGVAATIVAYLANKPGYNTQLEAFRVYGMVALILGLLCYAAGVLYYLRRAEP